MVPQNIWEKRPRYCSYSSYRSYGPIFFLEGLLVTVGTLVTQVTDGATEYLGEKATLLAPQGALVVVVVVVAHHQRIISESPEHYQRIISAPSAHH